MKFLELIESVPNTEASEGRLFGGIGHRVRDRRRTPAYKSLFDEARRLIGSALDGSRLASLRFEEAMSTDDFPQLFGDVIDRAMLGAYREFPAAFPAFTRQATVRDFRTVKRFTLDGAEGVLSAVEEGAEYPEASVSDGEYTYSVGKYGRVLPLFWETFINDDLDAFRDLPLRLGRSARRTEQKLVTQQYIDTTGPHASLYTSGNSNIINTGNGAATTNPALSVAGLQDGFTVLSNLVDADSEPILVDAVVLVVPPALEVTARNILNATEIRAKTSGGATSAQELVVGNWMKGRLTLAVDPYLPIVASSSNGSTTWCLFAAPSVGRPALELGRLRGHEEPEIWMKSPNAQRVGGGTVGPDQGDFETDEIRYRVRHVCAATRLDGKATVGSDGSGS